MESEEHYTECENSRNGRETKKYIRKKQDERRKGRREGGRKNRRKRTAT